MKKNVEILLYFVSEDNIEFVSFLTENIPYDPKKKWCKGEKVDVQNDVGNRVYLRSLCQYSLMCEPETIEIESSILNMCRKFAPYINLINDMPFREKVNIILMLKLNKRRNMQGFHLNNEAINFLCELGGKFELYI